MKIFTLILTLLIALPPLLENSSNLFMSGLAVGIMCGAYLHLKALDIWRGA